MADIFKHATLKTISSEVVKYKLFILKSDGGTPSIEEFEDCRIRCLALVTSLTKDYIWNNEGLNLRIGKQEGKQCLHGQTDFGDFIEDEWLIVRLFFQITKVFPNLICRVWDADGEFLLIEAADHLPKWLNIDTSKNRVFVHGGHLHIVTQPSNPGEIGKLPIGPPSLESALLSVYNFPKLSQSHPNIEEAILKRTGGFPEKPVQYVQKVNVFVPELIVQILDQDPNLISSAVRAFYFRDPIDLRACRIFKHFLPHTRVWSQISMNRCSYAQLMQQVFKADRRSGYQVNKNVGGDFKGIDLGSKLTHGFEILCANCKQNQTENEQESFDENAFQKYVQSLEKRGYFDREIQGSKRHNELMENARAYFSKFSIESGDSGDSISKTAAKRIFHVKSKVIIENLRCQRLCNADTRLELPEEDSDEWMYLTNDKMDDMLSEMQKGFQKLGKRVNLEQKADEETELGDLGEKMQHFVQNLSGYEGVEYSNSDDTVNFDPSGFEAALLKLSKIRDAPEDTRDSLSDDFLSSNEDSDSNLEQDSLTDSGIVSAMEQMDNELASTNVGKSFIKEEDPEENRDASEVVDIDLNLVQNFLKSCESEVDMPGAATTLLQSIGLGTKTP